jgi:rubrerythrin
MASIQTAAEALGVAIQIERNATDFYRSAARLHSSDTDSRELLRLAAMEDDHRAVFEGMLARLPGTQALPVATIDYLQAIADAHGGEGDPLSSDLLGGDETIEEILHTAIGLEKRSILFYEGIRDMSAEPSYTATIHRLIAEERAHVAALQARLNAVNA